MVIYLFLGILIMVISDVSSCKTSKPCDKFDRNTRATCFLSSQVSGTNIKGFIDLVEFNNKIKLNGTIKGLAPKSLHGFHIHEFGDVRNACDNAGGHFNPFNNKHGGPNDTDRHVGDLGNVKADSNGDIIIDIEDNIVTLTGVYTVIGKAIVLHEKKDTYTAQPSGDAGPRIACGVIGVMK